MHLTDNLADIVRILKKGGAILYPTDTIWGIGCSAKDPDAISKIYKIKNRPSSKPFILLVSDLTMLKRYIKRIHPRIETLLDYYDRPLTVVYEGVKNLPENAYSNNGSVAIRITKDSFCQKLISKLDAPLVSTSANFSGDPIPDDFDHIDPNLIKQVDYVVNYRQNDKTKKESSIIVSYDEEGELKFLRI